jgi:hypothetical protein
VFTRIVLILEVVVAGVRGARGVAVGVEIRFRKVEKGSCRLSHGRQECFQMNKYVDK